MSGSRVSAVDSCDSLVWQALMESAQRFEARTASLSRSRVVAAGLTLDLAHQSVSDRVLEQLTLLADRSRLNSWIEGLFSGESPWRPEQAALHWALRCPDGAPGIGRGVADEIHAQKHRMYQLARQLRDGSWTGSTGKSIRDIVHIGVGGSLNGCRLLVDALPHAPSQVRVHLASAANPMALAERLDGLQPETTLILIASRSFGTQDTLRCARMARDWLSTLPAPEGDVLSRHVIGISTSSERMTAWGIPATNQLHLPSSIHGRFSACSVMGLAAAVHSGCEAFEDLLVGARGMDEHFRTADWRENLPVLAGLLDVWNRSFLSRSTRVALLYEDRLQGLAPWLEQLDMESCGKSTSQDGRSLLDTGTAPLTWAGAGMEAKHSLFQFLREGVHSLVCELTVTRRPALTGKPMFDRHLVEAHAAARKSCDAALYELSRPGKIHGNRPTLPSLVVELEQPDARSIGALMSFYEHRVLVKSALWNINPFDQPGVDLAKSWQVALPA